MHKSRKHIPCYTLTIHWKVQISDIDQCPLRCNPQNARGKRA